MKRKIGELRNIPIVEGDKNLVREGTEIHINDLQSKGGSSSGGGISTDSFLYLKGTTDIKSADSIPVFYPFYRGISKLYPTPGESIKSKRVYFTVNEGNYGMHIVEIFKTKDLTCIDEYGMLIKIDTTSYNSLIESYVNSALALGGTELSKEEMITIMKSMMVEITKEEFEVIWNNYN